MAELLIVALAIFAYALVSERFAMSALTAPMVFTTIGLVVGAGGLEWFSVEVEGESTSVLVEATLVLILFTDAIRIDLRKLRHQALMPARLLAVGMPLTILAGTVVGAIVVPGLGFVEAAVLAAVLAPTDAALGQAVVSDKRLPVRLRQGLNIESGLNDGIAVPVVTVLIVAAAAEESGGAGDWVGLAARQIGFGLLAGIVAGLVGGRILESQIAKDAVEGVYRQLATISIAVAAFAFASLLDGNGFIAAFVAGLAFGRVAPAQCAGIGDFTEDEGELLSAITFVLFGAILAGPLLSELSVTTALYAVLSLTVVRMVPVLVAMFGSRTFIETRLFLGWFGPRGLASILFALIVLEELPSMAGEIIFEVAVWTVLLSVYAHGLTANWWTGRLAGRLAAEADPMPEMEPVEELPTRRRIV